MQTPPPDVFFHFTATGWTAIGSIVGAASIVALILFNIFTINAAFRATRAAEAQSTAAQTSLRLLQEQLALTERPFVAIHAEYCADINAPLIYAHNQGSGPALDVAASLLFEEEPTRTDSYSVGCMPVDQKFQFLIGDTSKLLSSVVIWYKSISGDKWTTKVHLLGGHPVGTNVLEGHLKVGSQFPKEMKVPGFTQ
jgi:hypothetical protein